MPSSGKANVRWDGEVEEDEDGLGQANIVMKSDCLKAQCSRCDKNAEGVFASLLCSYSTDDGPLHLACFDGEDSWRHYNRHKVLVAAGKSSVPRPHRPAFTRWRKSWCYSTTGSRTKPCWEGAAQ